MAAFGNFLWRVGRVSGRDREGFSATVGKIGGAPAF